jgi:hypothetical protein
MRSPGSLLGRRRLPPRKASPRSEGRLRRRASPLRGSEGALTREGVSPQSTGDSERSSGEFHGRRAVADPVAGADAVDCGHEVQLQAILIAKDSIQIGDRIVRAEDRGAKATGERLPLPEVPGRVAKETIEIDRRDWSVLKGRRSVTNEHGLELDLIQPAGNLCEQGRGVHQRIRGRDGPLPEVRSAGLRVLPSKVVHC